MYKIGLYQYRAPRLGTTGKAHACDNLHIMDLAKLKVALNLASKVDTVRQQRKKANGDEVASLSGSLGSVPAFGIDVDAVYDAAASLWSTETGANSQPASASWPAEASAAMNIGKLLKTDRCVVYHQDPREEAEYTKPCLEDEDGVYKLLLEFGLAQRLVVLLSIAHNTTPVQAPPDLEIRGSLVFTSSTAMQFCICQVRDRNIFS